MLELDPAKRISASDALESAWLKDVSDDIMPQPQYVLRCLSGVSFTDSFIDFRPIRIAMKCGVKNTNACLAVDGVRIRFKRISRSEKSLNINDTIKQRVRIIGDVVHLSFVVRLDMQMDSPDPADVITQRYVDSREKSTDE